MCYVPANVHTIVYTCTKYKSKLTSQNIYICLYIGIKLLEDQNSPSDMECLPTLHVSGM